MYKKILIACPECEGEGLILGMSNEGPYSIECYSRCNECEGSGEVFIYVEDDEEEQD